MPRPLEGHRSDCASLSKAIRDSIVTGQVRMPRLANAIHRVFATKLSW